MGETLPFTIDAVRPSIIQIRVAIAKGAGQVIGTGFLVHGGGYALTAKHVSTAAGQALASGAGTRVLAGLAIPNVDLPSISMRSSFELVECEIVEEDPRHDLALLKISPNPFSSGKQSGISRTANGGLAINALFGLAPLTTDRPRDGAAIAVSGYPLQKPVLITTAGIIASAWETSVADISPPDAPAGFTMPDFADSYLADVAVNPGNSGGPVYFAASGAVLGVCVAFTIAEAHDTAGAPLRYNSGLSVVIPICYGIDLAPTGSTRICCARDHNCRSWRTTQRRS
jgi:S1-C subfamily serine protease